MVLFMENLFQISIMPRYPPEKVSSGDAESPKEVSGVRWIETEDFCKITNKVFHPYHILDSDERKHANNLHQFPDLVTDKVYDIKNVRKVKIPKLNSAGWHEFDLNRKIFSYHETENRFIFAILPAFEFDQNESLKSGMPIFDVESGELISCVTKSYKNKLYAVSGIGWESGQIEKDEGWIGVSFHHVGRGESVYGSYYGPYQEVKHLAATKSLKPFGSKTGMGVFLLEKMVQIVVYDENGRERWRIRLFRDNCQLV